ncbi:MAG: GDSL-type esterase/lipase family protein [Rikenellaceae bacterium]
MKTKNLLTIAIALLFAITSLSAKTKIACVGNSITFGYGIAERMENSYPAQLQRSLGDEYEVQNYGVNGATILSNGNNPFIKKDNYKKSLEFNPDIVIIKLGTNDSKSPNMEHFADFEQNYIDFINSYKALESSPRIILVTPVICYRDVEEAIYDPRIVKQIIPAIENVAYATGVEIIDGHSLFSQTLDKEIFPDLLHPSAKGAASMVETFTRHLLADRDEEYSLLDKMEGGKEFNYHGYKGCSYTIGGTEVKIVEPKVANARHSWIQRARFWGNNPKLEVRLLELGFHLVYCDCTHEFGSEEAMKKWDTLFKIVTKRGLNKKMVVEGYSRGGLFVYNWVTKYPKRVSALYADAPVLDPMSWPLGSGTSKGSEEMTENILKAYGLSSREEMASYKGTPMKNAEKIAKSGVPLIHVIGTADELVPVAENTAPFAEAIRKSGGKIEIIEKEGIGHHPHSLDVPEPLVQFILKAEGLMK